MTRNPEVSVKGVTMRTTRPCASPSGTAFETRAQAMPFGAFSRG